MRLIRGLSNLKNMAGLPDSLLANGCVATIGNFDGVHRGHKTIIGQVKDAAAEHDLPAVVMVFEPQPREFFQGDSAPPRLMSFRRKCEALFAAGVDVVVCLQFDERFRQYSAEGFINEVLVESLGIRHLVVGDDFRFGHDRSGDFTMLERVGRQKNFTVDHTRTVLDAGERISSTRIRTLLSEGRLSEAALLLGHPYTIGGRVVYGRQLGRQLGVPTANLLLRREPPVRGVFVVSAQTHSGERIDGIANVGVRPTVDGKRPSLEVHLFDFAGTLYGRRLEVEFRYRLRDEEKFDSVDQLKEQIHRDLSDARNWLAEHG